MATFEKHAELSNEEAFLDGIKNGIIEDGKGDDE